MQDFLEQSFPFLTCDAGRLAGQLSQGQRQMLELSMSLLAEPRLLLLDEPCAGLSTTETQQQIDVILHGVARLGSTALVIEHDMAAVERLSDQVHVLHQGRLLASGSLSDVQGNPAVQAVYAGGHK
jgi:branched-chain amino acid transport system permease protein